jgi:uncharacterized membrane protein
MTKASKKSQVTEEVKEKAAHKTILSKILRLKYLFAVIMAFLLVYFYICSQFTQIPGPLYGGDLYIHYGIMNHIMNGNPPWTNPQMPSEYAHYPWITHLLAVGVTKLLGVSLFTTDIYFPLLIVVLGGLAAYLLGKSIFVEEKYAIFFCITWIGYSALYGAHPTLFTSIVIMPLFLFGIFYALKKKDTRSAVIAGVTYGLTGLGHGSAFMGASLFIALLFAYYCITPNLGIGFNRENMKLRLKANITGLKEAIKEYGPTLSVMIVVGVIIAMLYWGPPIFVYHGKTPNPWQDYGFIDYSKYGGETTANTLLSTFFNVSALAGGNFVYFIFSLLVSAGLYFAAKKRDTLQARFLLVLMLAGLVGALHFMITTPLLQMSIAPSRIAAMMLSPATCLLFIFGIAGINDIIKTKHGNLERIFVIAVLALLVLLAGTTINNYYNSMWAKVGRSQSTMIDALGDTANWVKENTDKNAVFISNNEDSFALNALTGRKIVTMRRTHVSMYVDIDARMADSAVILYGNDTSKALELARKYNITYLYWDANWIRNDFVFDENGQVVDISDPLMVPPTEKYKDYLTEYGVKTVQMNTWVDPANRGPKYAKKDMLVIIPQKLDPETPWSSDLTEHLKLVHESFAEGYLVARVYEIEY